MPILTKAVSAAASISLTILAVAASSPAAAATYPVAPQARVQTADLDLASATGHRIALRRISAAATAVCAASNNDRLGAVSCRAQAVADAKQVLNEMTAPQRMAAR